MAKIAAPSASKLLEQATELWPDRVRDADGIIPSKAHSAANPTSDHEPGAAGYCHAVDLTHDPANGCDAHAFAEVLRVSREPRAKYCISNRRIWTSYPVGTRKAYEWGPYGGSSPHAHHIHISIHDTKAACEDVSPWPLGGSDDMLVPYVPRPGFIALHRFHKGDDIVLAVSKEQMEGAVKAEYTYDGGFDLAPGGTLPLYQFWDGHHHFYTTNPAEGVGMEDQGSVVNVFPVGSGTSIHRAINGGGHLYGTIKGEAGTWEGEAFGLGVLEPRIVAVPADYEMNKVKAARYDLIAPAIEGLAETVRASL